MAEILIEAGADVNFIEEVDGVTPIHLASHDGISSEFIRTKFHSLVYSQTN